MVSTLYGSEDLHTCQFWWYHIRLLEINPVWTLLLLENKIFQKLLVVLGSNTVGILLEVRTLHTCQFWWRHFRSREINAMSIISTQTIYSDSALLMCNTVWHQKYSGKVFRKILRHSLDCNQMMINWHVKWHEFSKIWTKIPHKGSVDH